MNVKSLIIIALAACSLAGCGITGNLYGNPGFADFDSPGLMDTDRTTAISLGPLPLRLARAVIDDDPEAEAVLKGLKAIRVYVYEIDRRADRVHERLNENSRQLNRQGWQTVVRVNEADESTHVLIRERQGRIRGMAVLSSDGDELVMINMIGTLDPNMLAAYMGQVDVDVDVPELPEQAEWEQEAI